MGQWMDGYLDRLSKVRQENLQGGGDERIELQHRLGKLTARKRIERLIDPGTLEEKGTIVRNMRQSFDGKTRPSPSEVVVMGFGNVNGRQVVVYSMNLPLCLVPWEIRLPGSWLISQKWPGRCRFLSLGS